MSAFDVATMRGHAREIFDAAVMAVNAEQCVRQFVSVDGDTLNVGDQTYILNAYDQILVVGTGKASPQMGVALEDVLGDRISGGSMNTKYEHALPLKYIDVVECGHPVPDEAGVGGVAKMAGLLEGADEKTLVICLISGGGSALAPAPAEGLTLADKQETTSLLLE